MKSSWKAAAALLLLGSAYGLEYGQSINNPSEIIMQNADSCTSANTTFGYISSFNVTNTVDIEGHLPIDPEPIDTKKHTEAHIPVKEIEYVLLVNASDNSLLMKRPDKLYVEFSHRGRPRGKSMPLSDHHAYVNLPILATEEAMWEPIKCTIKRHRRFFPDKVLFTSDIDLRDSNEVTSVIRDLKGNDTGARIKLHLFFTEWVAGTFDGFNPPRNIDHFYLGAISVLDYMSGIFFIGGTEVLQKPREVANPEIPTVKVLDGLIEYPTRDEFLKPYWEITYVAPLANKLFPMTNRNNLVQDRATMRNEIRTEKIHGNVVEPYEGRWIAPLSDDSMHRVFFASMGMFGTRKINNLTDTYSEGNEYVADWTYLTELAYKKRFENIGCKVYFDSEANISLIEDNDGVVYRPGGVQWEWAKLKARSAAFTQISLQHLVHYHLNWANIPAMALRKYLQPRHPVRVALTPHFFRTHQTCLQSKDLLVAERGPLHRVLPFEYKGGLEKAYKDLMNNFQFNTWPEELKEKGILHDEFHVGATDGLGLHKVMMDYVSNLLDEIYPNIESLLEDDDIQKMYSYLAKKLRGPSEFSMDNLKMIWGEVLFRVTGVHTSIGNAAVYALEPYMVNFRLNKADRGILGGSREVINALSFITGLTVPGEYPSLSQNWTHVMPEIGLGAYEKLKFDLTDLGKEVDERNAARRFRNIDFHPEITEISIFS
jgi:hypothetical protein